MTDDVAVQSGVLVSKIEKALSIPPDHLSKPWTWESQGILGQAMQLMYTLQDEGSDPAVVAIATSIRTRDINTLLALARRFAFSCCCSYPHGPHTLACMNTNHRLRGAVAPGGH